MSTLVALDAAAAVSRFAQAWNTRNAEQRLRLLQTYCAPDAEFTSPHGVVTGIQPFNDSISAFLRAFPRAQVLFGPPDAHNAYARVRWRTLFNDNARDPIFGDDFIEFDANGRIVKVVSFDGGPTDV